MARNLEEPGANFNQLLELSIKLQNARTFAGTKVADASTEMEQSEFLEPKRIDIFGNVIPAETLEDWDVSFRRPNAAGGRIYGGYAQQIADGGRVGYDKGGGLTSKAVSWFLSPQNLERLKNNKDLVRKLTKNKMLPSSVRLYLRNLAGVTDKITEDFFSKSELAEIKRRVTEAETSGSMGYASSYGITDKTLSSQKKDDGVIGYSWGAEPMSIKAAFTSPESNIDMTLGQATFSKDEKGNFIVKDEHNFHGVEGSGYAEPEGAYSDYKGEYRPLRFPKRQEGESDKQLLKRAKKALGAGNIGSAKYARIIAGLKQEEGIPVELNIGKITQEDKYKADREFARYIATDTIGDPEFKYPLGKRYEDVGIPSEIRKQAQEYLKAKGGRIYGKYAQQLASGGRVGYDKGDIVPKVKPSEEEIKKIKWMNKLNILKKAKGGMGHRGWLNMVSEHLDDGLKAGIISKEQFNEAIMPLFGQAGEVQTRALGKDDSLPVKDLLELQGEKREDYPDYLLAKGGRVGLVTGSGDYAKKYLKYGDKATQDKFNKLVNELRINMSFESAISEALREIREGSD